MHGALLAQTEREIAPRTRRGAIDLGMRRAVHRLEPKLPTIGLERVHEISEFLGVP